MKECNGLIWVNMPSIFPLFPQLNFYISSGMWNLVYELCV